MSAPLTEVLVAGQPVACVDVKATITHGRRTRGDGPTASSATVTLYQPAIDGMPAWQAGDTIEVRAHGTRTRFTGTITDLDLSGHPNTDQGRAGRFDVQASGRVATLGQRELGDIPWPAEPVADRARRILADANVPYTVEGTPTLRVRGRDVDRRTALDLLTGLAVDTGAAVFDTPEGGVVFQTYAARAQTWTFRLWREAPGTWAEQSQWWADWNATATSSPTAPVPIGLDMCAVGWEPVWRTTSGDLINDVTLTYGPTPADDKPRPVHHAADPASVARYGRRHYGAETELADVDAALERAGMILDLNAWPHWALDQVAIFCNDLTPADLDRVLQLRCGDRVQLTDLPKPAPDPDPVRIVEGWTHTLTGTRSDLLLHLSDPLHSYAGITWGALPPAGTTPPLRWQDVPADRRWFDALTLADLQPTRSP